jgi:nucleotide-binding universal stress UspA family protein
VVVEGDVMSVLSDAWARLRPDLVVMGIYGNKLTRFLKGSFAKDCLLGCSTDMLFVPTPE